MKYTKIKSEFIKKKIKETRFEDRTYIDDLIFLEQVILEEIDPKEIGWLGNMKLHGLKKRYYGEFAEIYMELNSKEWKKLQERDKKEIVKEILRLQKLDEEKERELEEVREDWVGGGGVMSDQRLENWVVLGKRGDVGGVG